MKIILWGTFALVALLWTGGAALTAQLLQWSAQGLTSLGGSSIGASAATVAVPPWLSPWIDAAAWTALLQAVTDMLASASAAMPTLGDVVTWLVPVVWLTWGLGLLTLLGVTLAATWLMRRFQHRLQSGPQAA